jgi:hypothetical protein
MEELSDAEVAADKIITSLNERGIYFGESSKIALVNIIEEAINSAIDRVDTYYQNYDLGSR